jgi:hypothetical protein
VSGPVFEVSFAAPDPACGHETSWLSRMWWDSESATYLSADRITACAVCEVAA